ncbi:MAG: iron chelate uptake ABC transporter family permease subunit [Blastococcus sp.]
MSAPVVRVPGRRPLRFGPVSTVWRPRAVVGPALLSLVAVLLLAVNVGLGDFPLGVPEVLRILAGGGEQADRFIVLDLRLPRSLTAVLVGLALGLSGAITQSLARNPLASPDTLGITAGAGAGAVAVIVIGGGSLGGALSFVGLPVAALAGGLATAVAMYALAWRDGVPGLRLILVGLALAAMLTAVTSWLLVLGDLNEATRATVWLTGSLNGRGWEHVVPVGLVVLVAGALALPAHATLAALRLGDDSARSLGVGLQRAQAAQLTLAVVLASVAVASAGPVAFVALIAPQVALRIVGSAGPPLLASGLTGAVILLGSDVVSRTVLPVELPVGVLTSAIGAPYLIYLLIRRSRRNA